MPPKKTSSPPAPAGQSRYRVEALAKGLRLLQMFTESRTTIKLNDLATETGIPLPTAFRLVMTLVDEGFLEQQPDGGYRPAPKVLALGFSALSGLDLVEISAGPLQRLADATGETVNLGVLSDDRVLYLVRLRNRDLVTANIQVGSRLPAVYTSMGKMLLASLDEADLRARVTAESFSAGAGPNAATSLERLLPSLRAIREQGWSVQDEELAYGLRSVAAPIHGSDGQVVASANIAVRAMEVSSEKLVEEIRPRILDTCREISSLLGHR